MSKEMLKEYLEEEESPVVKEDGKYFDTENGERIEIVVRCE